MAIKKYGPTTPGRRGMTVTDYSVLSKVAPERSLLEPMKKHSGRNNTGRITVRHQGGGNRTKYRVIDFKRQKTDMPRYRQDSGVRSEPQRIHRSGRVHRWRQELHHRSRRLKVGDVILSGNGADISPATACPSRTSPSVPSSTTSSCIPAAVLSWFVPLATWLS